MTETHAPDDLAHWPGDAPWQALPPSALGAFRLGSSIGFGIVGLVVGPLPALLFAFIEGPAWWQLALGLGAPVAFLALGFWQAGLAYRYTRWQLDDDGLRVRRGRFWRSEVLVPRARVQHLDIERGPVERRFGLATLVVHTAGTRMNAVRQPGFDEASASRLRDALVPRQREHDDAPHG
jgi:membrane protein YdbS with pleckstrin-like domain